MKIERIDLLTNDMARRVMDVIRLLILLFICISSVFFSQIPNFYLKTLLFAIDILLLIFLLVTSKKRNKTE